MTSRQSYEATCHCKAIGYLYLTARAPGEWTIRACQCSFCRAHAALSTSDPAGSLEFFEHARGALQRYQFGRKTADFLLCRNCGAYIGAMMQSGSRAFGVVNVRVLLAVAEQLPPASPMEYGNESMAERLARREARWTPIAVR